MNVPMSKTIILALDIATACGCADGAVGDQPRIWSWYLADGGASRPDRFLHLAKLLRRYFQTQPCSAVVYELPMPLGMMGNKKDKRIMMSEANVAFSRGAIGVVEMTCAEFGKPVEGVSVMDARQSVLGWRTNRDKSIKTKDRVMRDVRALGMKAEGDNEADSAVIWQYCCNRLNPRLAIAQTPLFRPPIAQVDQMEPEPEF